MPMDNRARGIPNSQYITFLTDLESCILIALFVLMKKWRLFGRIVYNDLCLHVLVAYAAVFMAGDLIDTWFVKLFGLLIDVAIHCHHIDVLFGYIKSMHYIF